MLQLDSGTSSPSSPLQPGAEQVLEITDLAFGGEGVGRIQDLVVFVPFVIPGEIARVTITEVRKNFARARLQEVLAGSPDRVQPGCRYFGDCGGCQYQHLAYPRQIEWKRKQVQDLFQRIGGFSRERVQPVIPCPKSYGYRNRIMIRSQWDKTKNGLNIGYIRHDNRLVVDVEECPIASEALNREIKRVRASPPPKGGLKVVLRENPQGWEVPPDSFFQNNFWLLPRLVEAVRECLHHQGSRFLIDAYCGVGFFSLELAGSVDRFIGVELDKMAVRAAQRNAAHRGIEHGEFVCGRTEELLPRLWTSLPPEQTTLILDPPRTGCPPEFLQLVREKPFAQVIYISCHPATLARDLNILCREDVFHLETVIPLDMFPQTQHVECVADVRRGRLPV